MAVTVVLAVMVRQLEPFSVAPLHELNLHPELGVAVRHTCVPLAYVPPDGFAVTVPEPLGDTPSVSVNVEPTEITPLAVVRVREVADGEADTVFDSCTARFPEAELKSLNVATATTPLDRAVLLVPDTRQVFPEHCTDLPAAVAPEPVAIVTLLTEAVG